MPRTQGSSEALAPEDALFGRALLGLAVLEQMEAASVVADASGRVTFWNEGAERLYGWSSEEAVGRTLGELDMLGEDPAPGVEILERLTEGKTWKGEFRVRGKGGEVRDVYVIDSPIFSDSGELEAIAGVSWDISDRKRAEEERRIAQERYETIFLSASAGVAVVGEDDRWASVNPAFEKITGYTAEEARQLTFRDITHPEDLERDQHQHNMLLRGQIEGYEIQKRYIRKDGEIVWVRNTVSRTGSGSAERPLVMAIINDVTEERRAAEALAASEERFRRAFEDAHLGMALTDTDHHILSVNEAFRQMLGYSFEEFQALGWVGVTHPDDLPQTEGALDALSTRRSENATYQKRYLHKDGRHVWARVTVSRVEDLDGKALHFLGIIEDITDSKRAAEALTESEERFRGSFENAVVGMAITDDGRKVLEVNDAYCRMLGYTREEILQSGWHPLTHPEDQESNAERVKLMLEGSFDRTHYTKRYLHKDGHEVWAEISLSLIGRDSAGKAQLLSVAIDVTERVNAAKQKEVLRTQLLHAQKMEAVGQLAGGVAHDFNNLLFVILGCAKLLREDLNQQLEVMDELNDIIEAGERGADLVRQLLTFSRGDVAQPQIFNMNDVLQGIHRLLRQTLREDIDLLMLLEEAPQVFADPHKFEQIILNLAVNARDSMPDGGTLEIRTSTVNGGLQIEVSDTGCGMDEETLRRIFEPFFTTKEKGAGTGLGLPMAYGVVEQAGGTIEAASHPGKGTTFRIWLPGATSVQEHKPQVDQPALSLPGSGERILVAEDEDAVRALITRILSSNGYEVIEAPSGAQALRAFEEVGGEIDLLLTDVVMPRMSGPDLAEALKERREDLKVVFVSGYPDGALGKQGVSSNETYLPKPFDASTLLSKVHQALHPPPGDLAG